MSRCEKVLVRKQIGGLMEQFTRYLVKEITVVLL